MLIVFATAEAGGGRRNGFGTRPLGGAVGVQCQGVQTSLKDTAQGSINCLMALNLTFTVKFIGNHNHLEMTFRARGNAVLVAFIDNIKMGRPESIRQ